MDTIQTILIKAGRKDLAQQYYKKISGVKGYTVQITYKGKLSGKPKDILFTGDMDDCERFIRTLPIKEKNNLLKQDKSLSIVSLEGREIPSKTASSKIYVGINSGKREIFKSDEEPTEKSHGSKYKAVIGPFNTMLGAKIMKEYGDGNPHIQSVADAEKFARKGKEWLTDNGFEKALQSSNDSIKKTAGKKVYYIQERVGSAKYLVSFHDGVKTHKDGSDFYDIKIFKNKKDLEKFEQSLLKDGYKYKTTGK